MPKQKKKFEIKRINKRKKGLVPSRFAKMKRWLHRYSQTFRYASLLLMISLAMLLVYQVQREGAYLFKASVLEAPAPFDGTVYPVEHVPDWTNWNGDNQTTAYTTISHNLLVALPNYNLEQMLFPSENLVWGNSDHDVIRNTKITYPVVYMGNYKLDHAEYAGSHPAVDIKMPIGTPVKSIANGRVTKVSMQSSGFGHHIVIEHENVPDPENSSLTTTLYASFNHMDEIYVTEGETVSKGQLIGTSGDTGTATTPHLHFQIDRASAPWHPYWPFTSAESQAAGLSFFEAVNAGLGQSNAIKYTVNPMAYVAQHLNNNGNSYSSGTNDSTDDSNDLSDSDIEQNDPENEEESSSDSEMIGSEPTEQENEPVVEVSDTNDDHADTSLFAFDITGESVSMINNGVTLTATDNAEQLDSMRDSDTVEISLSGVGRISKKSFRKADFNNGSIQFIVNSSEVGTAQIEVGKSVHSVSFIDEVKPVASLRVDTDGAFQKGQIEVIEIVALDQDGNETPAVNFSGTIEISAKQGQANFTPERLAVNNFVNGMAEVRLQSSSEDPIIVRAQNGALVGESDTLYVEATQIFSDVSKSHSNYEAIKYLEAQGIINGYEDGTFKPEQTVNRVEALKMLMIAFDLKASVANELPFSDTDGSAWYASTLATALDRAIVEGYDDGSFRPSNTVNKAEYLKMLFLTGGIIPDDESLTANPYSDVPKDSWYAPYAYLTNKMNLLAVANNRLSAGSGMTRGDVAETIYRLKYIQDHNLVTFSGN